MMKLSEEGFCFTENDLTNFCDKAWTKEHLHLYYAFFKKYDPTKDINEQRRDYLGNGRYWNQIFSFGGVEYLITSEWYKGDKPYFIKWFNDYFSAAKSNSVAAGSERAVLAERQFFWEELNKSLISRGKPFNVRKATTDHWYDVSLGTSAAQISITLVNKENSIGIELYISDNKALFDKLAAHKQEIEREVGFSFEWCRLDNKKAARIKHYFPGLDFSNHDNYPELIEEAIDKAIKMKQVFPKYMK